MTTPVPDPRNATREPLQLLETTIPPPVVMLLGGLLAWMVGRHFPEASFQLPFHAYVASAFGIAGLAFNLYPKLGFDRAGTTVNPLRPASTTSLVTSGLYRYTRNPMYLGQALMLLGWTIYLQNFAGLLAVPAFVLYISRFQIRPEERTLAVRFPGEYAAFAKRSRRWL